MLTVAAIHDTQIADLLSRYSLGFEQVADNAVIPGSFWGAPEAGLKGRTLYARADTPVHSVLHEACHFICMTPARRATLDTNAGGDYDEENAVCYLQILLAGGLPASSCQAMCADMDEWGYTFRLGSAGAWFRDDAQDARDWLVRNALLTHAGLPTFRLRGESAAA